MGYVSKVSALVYRVVKNGDKAKLEPVGTAFVGEDGKTLAIELDETVTVGPGMPLVVRGV